MSAQTVSYTPERKQEILDLLATGESIRAVSVSTGVDRSTLGRWRDSAIAAGDTREGLRASKPLTPAEWSPIYGIVAQRAAEIIHVQLERYEDIDLSPSQLRDVAIVAGIMADKHLDYRDGRKGALISFDQSQNLNIPEGTSLEQLKQLRDDLKD